MTTWSSAGNDGGLVRARGVGLRALPRGSALGAAADAGRMAPLP